MRDIILVGTVCVAYASYVLLTTTEEPKKGPYGLAGLDRRPILDEIQTALRQCRATVVCLRGDRLELSLGGGDTSFKTHVREGLRRFLGHRLAVVWHLTEHPDVRYTLVFSLLNLLPALNTEKQPLDWRREWRDVMGIARTHDFAKRLTIRPYQ